MARNSITNSPPRLAIASTPSRHAITTRTSRACHDDSYSRHGTHFRAVMGLILAPRHITSTVTLKPPRHMTRTMTLIPPNHMTSTVTSSRRESGSHGVGPEATPSVEPLDLQNYEILARHPGLTLHMTSTHYSRDKSRTTHNAQCVTSTTSVTNTSPMESTT
jgi:hypothetical protein